MRNKEIIANLILLIVAIIWGGGFIAGKMALTTLTPVAILMYRFGLGALLCGIAFWNRIKRTPLSVIKKGVIIGVIQMVGLTVQLSGLQYTSTANQSFLCTAYVAFVPFISWVILRKRPEAKAFVAGMLALVGIGLICLDGGLSIGMGDSLSIMFSVIFGVQIVVVGMLVDGDIDVFQLSFFQLSTSAVCAFLICFAQGQLINPFGVESMIGVLYLGILNTFVAFLAQNYAQKYTKDTVAALIMSLESVFGFLLSVLYYNEAITLKFLLGSVLCFVAILINTVRFTRNDPK
ncbi:MAG: DMT family transporter [Firmicutes bacterium]|nr:DMT family transporter [Bacillota bacterium]